MLFGTLGPLSVVDGHGHRPSVTAGKQRSVLAALLMRPNQAVSVDWLSSALWEGQEQPAGARSAVTNYVARLRRILGPDAARRLTTVGGGYRLEIQDPEEVDHLRAGDCEQAAREAAERGDWSAVEALSGRALALWRGRPLEDVPAEALQAAYRPPLDELKLRLEELRIDAAVHTHRFHRALPGLAELVREHPLHEPLQERGFVALYATGQRGEALARYRTVRRLLRDELGAEPSRALRELHRLALAEAPPAELVRILATRHRGADTRATGRSAATLTGLEGASAHGAEPAQDSGPRDTTVDGPDEDVARGATTVALAWADRATGVNRDAQVTVGGVEPPEAHGELDLEALAAAGGTLTPEQAVGVLLDCLGVPEERRPATPEGRIALHGSAMAGRRILLLLDSPPQPRP